MIRSHLTPMAKCPAVLAATEEFCLRILAGYVTTVSLLRPVNEMSRLRTAKDMAVLEALVFPHCQSITAQGTGDASSSSSTASVAGAVVGGGASGVSNSALSISANASAGDLYSCPVIKEFKAFRQLLFAEDAAVPVSPSSTSSAKQAAGSTGQAAAATDAAAAKGGTVGIAPSRARLLSLPYISALRPSTLLGHLISCAPSQLPSPHESGENNATAYIEALNTPPAIFNKLPPSQLSSRFSEQAAAPSLASIRSLFTPAKVGGQTDWRQVRRYDRKTYYSLCHRTARMLKN